MTRPKKLALEGIAAVVSAQMAEGGELETLMQELPEHEHAAFQAAVRGFAQSVSNRATRTTSTPLPDKSDVRKLVKDAADKRKAARVHRE